MYFYSDFYFIFKNVLLELIFILFSRMYFTLLARHTPKEVQVYLIKDV